MSALCQNRLGAVIFAAGQGTRMYSSTPKVLLTLLEKPMLGYVQDALDPLCPGRVHTLIGFGADKVRAAFPEREGRFIVQEKQLGTGHALLTAVTALDAGGGGAPEYLLVINGDTPLVETEILRDFTDKAVGGESDLAFISLSLGETGAFGLVLRRGDEVAGIVEARDFDETRHGPKGSEVNAGVYCFRIEAVRPLLPLLSAGNRSGELYITDLVELALGRGLKVWADRRGEDARLLGVNTPVELSRSEERLRARIVERHLESGVLLRNPGMLRIGPEVVLEKGADVTGPCEIYGASRIAAGVRIASHCRLVNAVLERNVEMRSFCHVEDARIGERCVVGPYARLRPGAVMDEDAHVGNFVEMKKARLGAGAKANHLAYLGDAEVGAGANIGAGTITCNYDGRKKHLTRIGEKAFIGSNASLVAPVDIGAGALIGAGSVISKDVPENKLGLARAKQLTLPKLGW
ncbi:MAG: bifunctional UDP-N-acetylglucosamine diphosphorylase/glucosamine-1-phosphate N-acetyltransferase GlmU [Desulfovibrio sp.]|jgi:bifunctional UDP-N-acetylglucosamine pyrophosphorylase/glucosamine-1-phosphate N-acetyltransferase|nr:bifunctional UDP-N-acetylglucosamine diphosphorylase/glucosamine-1-phosphate N-acetyltransferase GlmU [Desulfovibrio sp.]